VSPTKADSPSEATTALGPRPETDIVFEDKTRGYSPEQHDKLLSWVANTAAAKAVEDTEKRMLGRLKPIEDQFRTAQSMQEELPRIRKQMDEARKLYGSLFDDDYKLANEGKSEILALMQQNKAARQPYLDKQMNPPVPYLTFEQACAHVLVPKLSSKGQADRDSMRTELLDEINKRPAAAARTGATASSAAADSGPKTTEDIIRESIRRAGLK
jgi:hypothetical protein